MRKAKSYRPQQSGAKKFTKPSPYKEASWVEFRLRFLKENPKCYCCGQWARVVDHFVAHRGDRDKFEKSDNMIPMCKTCHSTVTQLFDRGVELNVEGKLKWIAAKREETGTNTRVMVIPWTKS